MSTGRERSTAVESERARFEAWAVYTDVRAAWRAWQARAALSKTESNALTSAAIAWWRMHRPLTYTEAEHIANPAVNCSTAADSRLAVEVGRHVAALKGTPA